MFVCKGHDPAVCFAVHVIGKRVLYAPFFVWTVLWDLERTAACHDGQSGCPEISVCVYCPAVGAVRVFCCVGGSGAVIFRANLIYRAWNRFRKAERSRFVDPDAQCVKMINLSEPQP